MPAFPSVSVPGLYSQLLTAVRAIPRDPLRPSLQLPQTLETLVQRSFKRPIPAAEASNAHTQPIKELTGEEVDRLGFGIGDLTRLDRSLKAIQEINQDSAFHKVSLFGRESVVTIDLLIVNVEPLPYSTLCLPVRYRPQQIPSTTPVLYKESNEQDKERREIGGRCSSRPRVRRKDVVQYSMKGNIGAGRRFQHAEQWKSPRWTHHHVDFGSPSCIFPLLLKSQRKHMSTSPKTLKIASAHDLTTCINATFKTTRVQ